MMVKIKTYNYETPLWAVIILSIIALAMSALSFIGVYQWEQWASGEPVFIRWLLFVIGLVFFISGIKPRNWKPWRYFYADMQGIHFPTECPETKSTEWLLVPWSKVGDIKKEMFLNRHKGPSIELLLNDDEINRFFRDVKLAKMFFGNTESRKAYFKVGYSNAFKRINHVVRVLNDFKKDYA